jgi:hypothetical protein
MIDSAPLLVVAVDNSRFLAVMDCCSIRNLGIRRARRFAVAQARWRDASPIVALRWDGFLRSEADSRVFCDRIL